IEHKEKLIAETLHYNPHPEEILGIDIINGKLSQFPQEDKVLFEDIVKNNDIVNIRILMRIFDTVTPLYEYVKSYPHLSWRIPSTILLNSICSFFILLFLHNHSLEELLKDQDPTFLLNTEESSDSERVLWLALNNYKIKPEIKRYYSGQASLNDILDVLFYEAKPLTMREIAISVRPELHEINENELSNTLVDLICRKIDCNFYEWIKAFQNYEYLTTHKYLPKSPIITLKFVTSILNGFTDNEVAECFELYSLDRKNSLNSGFEDSKLLYSISLYRYESTIKMRELNTIKLQLELKGWASFNANQLTTLDPFGNYKPLEVLGVSFVTRCVLKNWAVNDIEQFSSFLRSNYQISNIKQFATNEKNKLIYLSQKLDIFCLSNKESFKFGAIYDLNRTVKIAINKL
ncbi:hypothetical protein EKP95_21060, partial [Escherichia coli]|nr:hypothetical protein [Escherichia coli]